MVRIHTWSDVVVPYDNPEDQLESFQLGSAHHPFSTSLSVGNLLAVTKRTVKITDSS